MCLLIDNMNINLQKHMKEVFEFWQFSETRQLFFCWAVFGRFFIGLIIFPKKRFGWKFTIAKQNLIHEGDAASCLDDDDGLLQCSCACVSIQKSTPNSD